MSNEPTDPDSVDSTSTEDMELQPREWSNTQPARLDVATWVLHDETPHEFDAALDARARRTFTVFWTSLWSLLTFAAVFVIPSLMGTPTFDPIVLILVTGVIASVMLVTRRKHLALRKTVGVPIIDEIKDALDPLCVVMQCELEMIADCQRVAEDPTNPKMAEAKKVAKQQRSGNDELGRKVTTHAELAARYAQRGRTNPRNRHIRRLMEACHAHAQPYINIANQENASAAE